MLELLLMTTPHAVGQQTFTTAGTQDLVVPQGVNRMSAVAVGGGQSASNNSLQHQGGTGGALRYRNWIPVRPGEHLSVIVGKGGDGLTAGTKGVYAGAKGLSSGILRNGVYILRATGGGEDLSLNSLINVKVQLSGPVGSGLDFLLTAVSGVLGSVDTLVHDLAAPIIGGGNGGVGGTGTLLARAIGGGGAGGYLGDGSIGVNYGASQKMPNDTGAGYGGIVTMVTANLVNTYTGRGGGGIRPMGRIKDNPGSGAGFPSVISGGGFGGGGATQYRSDGTSWLGAGGNGAVRVIWGVGRGFPDQKTLDQNSIL